MVRDLCPSTLSSKFRFLGMRYSYVCTIFFQSWQPNSDSGCLAVISSQTPSNRYEVGKSYFPSLSRMGYITGRHGTLSVTARRPYFALNRHDIQAQHYDGNISIPGCDKNMPGCLMAAARHNRPTIIIYG